MAKITWVLDDDAKKILEQAVKEVLQWYIEKELLKEDGTSANQKTKEESKPEKPEVKIGDHYDAARKLASRLVNTGRGGQVRDLLGYFGVAKISDVPEDKIEEFTAKLQQLLEADPL